MSRWWDWVEAQWIAELCAAVGVDAPLTFEHRVDASERIHAYFLANTEAVFPGAAEAISAASVQYEIHMASGNPSWIVECTLQRLGVRHCVGRPFGSDLVGVHKGQPGFYPMILDSIGASAAEVAVVDDGDTSLANAAAAGILPIKVGTSAGVDHPLSISTIASLPSLLLDARR